MLFKNANGTVISVTDETAAALMRESAAFEEIPEKPTAKKATKKSTK